MATCDVDFVVLAANGLVQKSADVSYPFRQDSNFWYLTGLNIADAVLVIDVKKSKEFIIAGRKQTAGGFCYRSRRTGYLGL